MKLSKNYVTMAAAVVLMLAPAARAGCASSPGKPFSSAFKSMARVPSLFSNQRPSFGDHEDGREISIVGFWNLTLFVDGDPNPFDQGFEQWHSDGTELLVDNAFSPAQGNVCVGVYKQTGPRTYKLRHTTWNWDDLGHNVGSFVLIMTITMDRRNAFHGSFVIDNYDTDGNILPDQHAEGTAQGTRITVD
jgi:hypothetical protein